MSKKPLLEQTQKIKTMHTIAFLLVLGFLIITGYQMAKANLYMGKELLASEEYERIIMALSKEIGLLVTMVVVYFFGKESGKKDTEEIEQKNCNCNKL